MSNIQSEITAARLQLDVVSAKLRELEARAAEEARKPWDPKGGDFIINAKTGEVTNGHGNWLEGDIVPGGWRWQTREAALSAAPYRRFFMRYLQLAAELNPSGKVGGDWAVVYSRARFFSRRQGAPIQRDVWDVFQTEEAANKAVVIMNRDKWVVPALT
jgi:hypothetical protein